MSSSSANTLHKIKIWVLISSTVLYLISLTQPAFTYQGFDGLKTHPSVSLLFMGAIAILGGGIFEWIVWWANPLYLVGLLLLFRSNKSGNSFALLAGILSLSFLKWDEILASESGGMATIVNLNSGYWLWLISLMILTIGSFYYFYKLEQIKPAVKSK